VSKPPEVLPPEPSNIVRSKPSLGIVGKVIRIAIPLSIAAFFFWLFTFALGQFFQIRGVQHLLTSRIFLAIAYISLAICIATLVYGLKLKWAIQISVGGAIVLLLAALLVDRLFLMLPVAGQSHKLAVKGTEFTPPSTVGEKARAQVIIENKTDESRHVRIWQEAAYWTYFGDKSLNLKVQEQRWSALEQYVRTVSPTDQIIPSNFGQLGVPFETPSATQRDLTGFAVKEETFYLMMIVKDDSGKRVLELCEYLLDKSTVNYCYRHNGP